MTWDPLFEDLRAPIRQALDQSGYPTSTVYIDPGDYWWAVQTGIDAVRAVRMSHPDSIDDATSSLEAWMRGHREEPPNAQDTDTLTVDAHPCEGPGSDPQDLLPDDRAWGSRTPPTDAP